MTVKDIILDYLEANGFDGLCTDECGCVISDFMICGGEYIDDCEPAYKLDIPEGLTDMDGDYYLYRTKEQMEEAREMFTEWAEEGDRETK